jgi:hypothetical protein
MHRSCISDDEPFNMSRESFDSYRRSFVRYILSSSFQCCSLLSSQDILARSPITDTDSLYRRSLDSSILVPPSPAQTTLQERRKQDWPDGEDYFEDVKLNEEMRPAARIRGLFSKFGTSAASPHAPPALPPSNSATHRVLPLFSGRKRGQSIQGAEMATIPQSRESATVGVDGDDLMADSALVQ